MNSQAYVMLLADSLSGGRLGATIGKPRLSDDLANAIAQSQELRKLKDDRSWRRFIENRGVVVYGTPMSGIRGFLDTNGPPTIVVDNSVPESCQTVAMVKQYLHLELNHAGKPPDALQDMETNIAAYLATVPQGSDRETRDDYLKENPEMKEVDQEFTVAGITLLVIVGVMVVGSLVKGAVQWVKA